MAVFFDNSITDIGKMLWAEIQAGGSFEVTRIVMGSGYLPTGKTTRTVTKVAEPVKNIELNKKNKLTGGDYVFGGIFSNKEVEAAFYYRELGLYAKVVRPDGTETDETLYSYGNAGDNAEVIPAYGSETAVERQLDVITYIGNDAIVNLEIASGVMVSKQEFNKAVEELTGDIGDTKSALEGKVDKADGKGLSTNDFSDSYKGKVDNFPGDISEAIKNSEDKADEEFAPKQNPELIGVPTAPTAEKGTSTSQIATTQYVMNALADFSGGVEIGATAPTKTNVLWIDTGNGGIAKYHDSTGWVTVAGAWG